jgi:hypothetical protein
MSDLAMTAERALLNMFTDLHRAGLPDVATTLSELCDRVLDTTTATTGQHLAIVQMLRDAHPAHSDLIFRLVVGVVA